MNASATAARREQLQATVAAGATIVHSFHVDGVRTILPILAVLSLVATRVRGVTVPQDYSISAFVDFRGSGGLEGDLPCGARHRSIGHPVAGHESDDRALNRCPGPFVPESDLDRLRQTE